VLYKEYGDYPIKNLNHKPKQLTFEDAATNYSRKQRPAWEAFVLKRGIERRTTSAPFHGCIRGSWGQFRFQLANGKARKFIGTSILVRIQDFF